MSRTSCPRRWRNDVCTGLLWPAAVVVTLICAGSPAAAAEGPGSSVADPLTAVRRAVAERRWRTVIRTARLAADAPETSASDRALAKLALARAHLRLGEGQQAFDAVRHRMPALQLLSDEVTYVRAEGLFLAGRPGDAIKGFQLLVRRSPESARAPKARFRVADCELLLGRKRAARERYGALLQRYPEVPFKARTELLRAAALSDAGARTAAAQELQDIVLERRDPRVADEARRLLQGLREQNVLARPQTPAQVLSSVRTMRYWKRWPEVEELLVPLIRELSHSRSAPGLLADLRFERGLNLYAWGDFEGAQVELEGLHAGGDRRDELDPWRARVAFRRGDLDRSLALEAEFTPGGELAAARESAYFKAGRYDRALAELEAQARAARYLARGSRFRWRWAWYRYRVGQLEAARDQMSKLGDDVRSLRSRCRYWQGRIELALGRPAEARALWVALAGTIGPSYYALQARNRLAELNGARAPAAAALATDPDRHPGARIEWGLPANAPAEPVVAWRPPSTPQGAFRELAERYGEVFEPLRVAALWARIGDWSSAVRSLRGVAEEAAEVRRGGNGLRARLATVMWAPYVDFRNHKKGAWGRPLALEALPGRLRRIPGRRTSTVRRLGGSFFRSLGEAFAHAGDLHYARRYLRLPKDYRDTPPDGPLRALWARAYPQAYPALVRRDAAAKAVRPELLWALMTMESAYYPHAVSRADARGLMQVIPKTGRLIAAAMELPGYSASLLFEPEIAIRFACWYFRELLTKFRDQEMLAIAAYNAGPHNVAAWLASKPEMAADEFLEEMGFTNARLYTRRVLGYLDLYRRIYDGVAELYIPNTLDQRFRDNINF